MAQYSVDNLQNTPFSQTQSSHPLAQTQTNPFTNPSGGMSMYTPPTTQPQYNHPLAQTQTNPFTNPPGGRNGQILGDIDDQTQNESTNSTFNTGGTPPTSEPAGEPPVPQGPSQEEIDAIFNPLMGQYDATESQLRQDLPTFLEEIRNQAATALETLGTQRGQSQRQLTESERGVKQRRTDAVSAARRLFNELRQGATQRFGGASSAGEAAQALQGREFQRSQADIGQNFGNSMREIENQKLSVNQNYQLGVRQIEDRKNSQINEVNREFQNKLLEINNMRAETESAKAQMRLQALQQMRDQMNQIKLSEWQAKRNMELEAQAMMQELNMQTQALARAGSAGEQAGDVFGDSTTLNPQSQFSVQGDQGMSTAYNPTGMINQDDEMNPWLQHLSTINNPLNQYQGQ